MAAISPSWHVSGARELAAALQSGAARTQQLMVTAVAKTAADLVAAVQRNASGRPGPNVVTGDYRGSWRAEPVEETAASISISVGTDRPQAARLEYGFVGPDSLGRVYDQPPFPHMGPAVDGIEPLFYAAMDAIAAQATSW